MCYQACRQQQAGFWDKWCDCYGVEKKDWLGFGEGMGKIHGLKRRAVFFIATVTVFTASRSSSYHLVYPHGLYSVLARAVFIKQTPHVSLKYKIGADTIGWNTISTQRIHSIVNIDSGTSLSSKYNSYPLRASAKLHFSATTTSCHSSLDLCHRFGPFCNVQKH